MYSVLYYKKIKSIKKSSTIKDKATWCITFLRGTRLRYEDLGLERPKPRLSRAIDRLGILLIEWIITETRMGKTCLNFLTG